MRFEKKNIYEFQKVANSFHDCRCLNFNYDVINKSVIIETEFIGRKEKRKIIFNNVEYFEMVGGESWGGHSEFPCIIEWSLIHDNILLCKLKDYFLKQNVYNTHVNIPNFDHLFQTKILMISGNAIDILCEYIEIQEGNTN